MGEPSSFLGIYIDIYEYPSISMVLLLDYWPLYHAAEVTNAIYSNQARTLNLLVSRHFLKSRASITSSTHCFFSFNGIESGSRSSALYCKIKNTNQYCLSIR